MKTIHLSNYIELEKLLESYHQSISSFVNIQIGYDGKIYILLSENIPERIRGMFVNTQANTVYSAIRLTVDWTAGEILHQEFLNLGYHERNFHFIQPIGEKILLLGARCMYREDPGPEKNAVIVDLKGNIVNEFCLGDGIQDCIVNASGDIITSYFDEGVYGNYGWMDPIGSCGLIVWNGQGDVKWKASEPISDCYALNLDDQNNIWYYYYTDFCLVKTDLEDKIVYKPDVEGATGFLISADGKSLMFDGGYNAHGNFQVATPEDSELKNYEEVSLLYKEQPIKPKIFLFRGSKAIFIDSENRLFMKQFASL